MLSREQRELLVSGAEELGVTIGADTLERFSIYLALLQTWGKKINLTTRLETDDVIVYHFLDSLAGAALLKESAARRIVDLGAGAGFPSLPLKFALPSLSVVLVESVRKKVAFCQEVIRATGITDIEALWGRGEQIGATPKYHHEFDWAVSRALGSSSEVARLAAPFLRAGGNILLYKGEPDTRELEELDAYCRKQGGRWESRQVTVTNLTGIRSLITVHLP